jgi:hypothetical protein
MASSASRTGGTSHPSSWPGEVVHTSVAEQDLAAVLWVGEASEGPVPAAPQLPRLAEWRGSDEQSLTSKKQMWPAERTLIHALVILALRRCLDPTQDILLAWEQNDK